MSMSVSISPSVKQGISVVVAYTLLQPLFEDIQDSFGNAFLYHPAALWLCIITLVYSQTSDIKAGIVVVVLYEVVKAMWKRWHPEPPYIAKLRKLLHRLQNDKQAVSESDVTFLNSITPDDVEVTKKR